MRQRLLIGFAAVFGLFLGVRANPISPKTAYAIACKFMGTDDLKLSTTYRTDEGLPALYLFNSSDGFVIVSADDCETPIIGYSHEGGFDPNDMPIQMEEYLQDFVARIQFGITHQTVADEVTARQWAWVQATGRLNDHKSAQTVAPMITAKWHQGCLYNSLCPEMSGPCGHAEVGCVAVAMAQIMHYWQFPSIGNGSYSYYSTGGIQLSADFGNTVYPWDQMPDQLSDSSTDAEIEAVATLLYHCGVSVNMLYTGNGSGAHAYDVPDALTGYFKYLKGIHQETAGDDMAQWLSLLKASLDQGHPVFYSGRGDGSHAFVCDGYDENDLLHFNWGWGGNGDGYFALGQLNPMGHNYSSSNNALFDIIPDNTPHQVTATANPPYGGSIEGNGLYLTDEECTLIAIPAEHFEFYYWKRANHIVSSESSYSLFALNDIDDIEAVFSLKPVRSIIADTTNPSVVNLSWSESDRVSWPLLRQFDIPDGECIATDGHFLYLSKHNSQNHFWKYTMDGTLVEQFDLTGFSGGSFRPTEMTYNGTSFYCNGENTGFTHEVDLANHNYLSYIRTGYSPVCSYDSIRDGLWIASYVGASNAYRLKLVDPTGSLIKNGPLLPSGLVPNGSGFFVGEDRDSHLMLKTIEGKVFDYDIGQDLFFDYPITELGASFGAFIGKYEGRNALFVCYDNSVNIFEIRNTVWPITQYRLYRSDDEGNLTLLADEVTGISFTDTTWGELGTGLYRYGICSVFGNGNVSEMLWSVPIPKGNYDIPENPAPVGSHVEKVFEDGQIIIIKDGKRYNIVGQEIQIKK